MTKKLNSQTTSNDVNMDNFFNFITGKSVVITDPKTGKIYITIPLWLAIIIAFFFQFVIIGLFIVNMYTQTVRIEVK